MDARVKEFRKLSEAFGSGKGARPKPYPERCRNLALDYARERLGEGDTMGTISGALGINAQTLWKWRKRYGNPIRPVHVSEPEPQAEPPAPVENETAGPVLMMPSGARIEGLDVDGVIAVLKALG